MPCAFISSMPWNSFPWNETGILCRRVKGAVGNGPFRLLFNIITAEILLPSDSDFPVRVCGPAVFWKWFPAEEEYQWVW